MRLNFIKQTQQLKQLCLIAFFLIYAQNSISQDLFLEGGFGIGNVVGKKHRLGKAEIHLNIIKISIKASD